MPKNPIILWFRRDLRLADHQALSAAVQTGQPILPVFICDEVIEGLGAAPKWRFGLGVKQFQDRLETLGSKLILRRGNALEVLQSLIAETGATSVYWSRAYDPKGIERDTHIKAELSKADIDVQSFHGALLIEPWLPKTKTGGQYKVFTPFWKNTYATFAIDPCLAAPKSIQPPANWPKSDDIETWNLGRAMYRGADVTVNYITLGEEAAKEKLYAFIDDKVHQYPKNRDLPSISGTSLLSENLTYGEISPRAIYHTIADRMDQFDQGGLAFLRQLYWREFSYHLLWHFPELDQKCWRPEWDDFEWEQKNHTTMAWKQGMTGQTFVDAGMRELYTTGIMHNRLRMIVGSYLTKNLLTDWRVGLKWFEDCLIDWDPAANAMGWQWIAGCGPDAALYFRVFNPALQSERFDIKSIYQNRWLKPHKSWDANAYFNAVPKAWRLSPDMPYPQEIMDLKQGRQKALDAYARFKA